MAIKIPEVVPEDVPENPLVAVPPAALEAMERAQIDVMIATAKRYPRPEIAKIRQRVESYATIDEETAESCIYTLKRWDKEAKQNKLIQGASIRLAEIVTVCWQNIWAGARTIGNDGQKVTAQGQCFDLENNVRMFAETSRRITDKNGQAYSEDMQLVTAGAACSIAKRNAVFQVVPFALIKPAYAKILDVATGSASTLEVKRDKVFKRFYAMGVAKERILAVVGKEAMESIDLEDLGLLIGLGTAIRDKELTIEEVFQGPSDGDDTPPVERARSLHEMVEKRRAEKAAAEAAAKEKKA